MSTYISKRKYGPRDLMALGLAITARLTATNKAGVLRNIHRAWNNPTFRLTRTIGVILVLAPWAALAGIIYMAEQVMAQRHPKRKKLDIPLPRPDLTVDMAVNIPPTPIGWDRIDAAYDLPQEQPAPAPSLASGEPVGDEATITPPASRKRKKKATERTEEAIEMTGSETGVATATADATVRYRKKGNSYVIAKKRVKNETLFTRTANGTYEPIPDTVTGTVTV